MSLNLAFVHELGTWIWSWCAHAEYADGSFAVHPVTSENVSFCTFVVVVLEQHLYPNKTVYFLKDARAVRDSIGNPFVGLAGSDVKFGVAEQVIVLNGTVAIPAGEAKPARACAGSWRKCFFPYCPLVWSRGSVWQERSDTERFADWPRRLSQRGIGKVEGIQEGEPWLHFGDQ